MATKIIAVRAPLSHREASYGHPQGASGGAGAPKQKPRQGRGQVWKFRGGLPSCDTRQTHRHNTTVGCTARGRLAAVDKITLHVAARQH
jgi:hypothetical protein